MTEAMPFQRKQLILFYWSAPWGDACNERQKIPVTRKRIVFLFTAPALLFS